MLGAAIAAASGVLFALLGVAVLLVGKSGSAPRWAFGSFAALWGFQIFAGNASRIVGPGPAATTWTFLLIASLVVLYVPLVHFISVYPGERKLFARSIPAAATLLVPAAFGSVALVLKPEWFHLGFDAATGADLWGPLIPLFAALYFGAFDYAVWILFARYRASTATIEARRLLLLLAAFSLYVSYVSFEDLPLYAIPLASGSLPPSSLAPALAFLGLSLVGCALLARTSWTLLRERTARARAFVGAAVLLPALFGALSGITGAWGSDLDTIGLFRTASVVLIAYAILRYELFDIDVKVKRGAIVAGVLVLSALVAIGIEQGLERAVGSTGLAITITQFTLVGAVVAVVMKAPTVARAVGSRVLPALDAPERLDARRLEVYEAALAQAAGAPGGPDAAAAAPFLADLRARLGVSEAEHALLARLVAPPALARAPAPALEAGALVSGRYRLDRLLGEGSAGAAWLALDETLARRVVVKTLHARLVRNEEATRAFLREARVAAALDHENVVRVFDFGSWGDTPFLVMEFVEGGSLEDRLATGGHALPPAGTRSVVGGILAGLAHVHARGVLHRDLKPANVLLTTDGTAKISDFGVALATNAGTSVNETHTGLEPAPLPKGTLATMSPEAVRGLPLSPASDVYAVGAILYRCATGAPYVRLEGRSRESARAAILGEPPLPAPAGAPADLVRVALRALEKEPSRRYQTADEMREALDAQLVVRV